MSEIRRGDTVFYTKSPDVPMTAISNPEPYGRTVVVTCKWRNPKRKRGGA